MTMRRLTEIEETRLRAFTSLSVEVTLLEPTATGLKKSILDATFSVRRFLKDNQVHDYEVQKQGQESKILIAAELLSESLVIPSQASLYRPTTKSGDPRIWFKGLPSYSKPNDIIAIIVHNNRLHVINITRIPVETIIQEKKSGPIWELLSEINSQATSVSQELLAKLKAIARQGFIPSVIDLKKDTAIGRTLETALGIKINSRKEPDYKGIELKSFRTSKAGRENRKTLFAQVANWELSKFKSSAEILKNFGYARGSDFKLYCTVSTQVRNSQGLQFSLDQKADHLIETSSKEEIGDFAVWLMADLRKRLVEKHAETFWVSAKSHLKEGNEFFEFQKVLHTKKPIASQFDILVEQGTITMDHLIKRVPSGRVSEKGPLFKIEASALEMLFPPSQTYDLQGNQ
jgi:hypothetical protein